jgi:peptidoglycan/xylan/chitin deacetylase (PgdA/CDA1 family)
VPAAPGHRAGPIVLALLALSLLPLPLPAAQTSRTLAVTVDDLPFVGYGLPLPGIEAATRDLLAAFAAHRVPAIGFVNEDKLLVHGEVDRRIALLEAWLDGGHELGNHTYGHVGFQATPLAAYEEAVLKGEVVTRSLLRARGRLPRYFRHPFTQTGPTAEAKSAFEVFLREHGYVVAPFTVEHDDFVFARVYADALAKGDGALAERVREAYLHQLDLAMDVYESMAEDLFGRAIPQVLLIHASALNAACLEAMLQRLLARGYRFVSLDEALRDPAYASPDGFIGPQGPSWLLRFSLGLARPTRKRGQPDPPDWIQERYSALER